MTIIQYAIAAFPKFNKSSRHEDLFAFAALGKDIDFVAATRLEVQMASS